MITVKAIRNLSDGSREIRRVPMSRLPGELTFDELCIMIYRLFKLTSVDQLVLKYYDDEGDLVNLDSDIDITHALSLSNVLKVNVSEKSDILESKKVESQDQSTMMDDKYTLIQEKLEKILNFLSSRPLSKQEMGEFLPPMKSKEPTAASVSESTSVVPSATSVAGAVTPGRTYSVEESGHQRPSLTVGNSPSAQSVLGPSTGPMPPRPIPMGSGNTSSYYSGNQAQGGQTYGGQSQGGYIEGWAHPQPGSGMTYPPQQYPARPYYPPANQYNRPPLSNQPQYQRFSGN